MKIKQTLCALALATITALGVNGCSERDLPEPKPEYFACKEDRSRVVVKFSYPLTLYGSEFYALDVDCDGKIDVLNYMGHAKYLAKDYRKNKKISKHEDVQELTPKMRDLATQMSKLNEELAFEMAKDMYARQQAKKEEK